LAVGTPNNSVVVTDARGIKTAGGWNVTASTTAFTSTGTPADSIPGTPLVINGSNSSATASTAPVATCGAGSTCLLPSGGSAITYPLTLITTPTKVYSAGNNTGQGVISMASDFWLNIAASTLAHADYTATATIAVVSGP
jgi:hypothetical protein